MRGWSARWLLSGVLTLALGACNLFSKKDDSASRSLPAPASAPEPATVAPQPGAPTDPAAPAQAPAQAARPVTGTQPRAATTATGATAATAAATTGSAQPAASAAPAASTGTAAAQPLKLPSNDCVQKCQTELTKCMTPAQPGTLPDLSKCNAALASCQKACQ